MSVVDVGKVDAPLREEVEAKRHEADVAGALAITEETPLDPLRAGHECEFGRRNATAAVVVRVDRKHDRFASREMARHPFDLVGVDVRRGHFDGRRKVDDHLVMTGSGLPDGAHGVTHFHRKVELGCGKALRRVLETQSVDGARRRFADDFGARDGDIPDARAIEAEHKAPLRSGRRIVEMHDRALGARHRVECLADDGLARLRQHLYGHVVRDQALFDQLAHEVIIRLRRRRETDLDFLVTHIDQQLEHPELAFRVHRLDQRLVAVAQVDAAPHGRLGDRARRPRSVMQADRRKGLVLGSRVDGHGSFSV